MLSLIFLKSFIKRGQHVTFCEGLKFVVGDVRLHDLHPFLNLSDISTEDRKTVNDFVIVKKKLRSKNNNHQAQGS